VSAPRPDAEAIAYAGVVGQAELLRDGALTSLELVNLLLDRVARFEPRLNAFRLVLADQARADAAAADAARRAGDTRPLLGVPIALKDNIALAGTSSMYGTGSPEPVAHEDDELTRRIRDAGMVVLGKTHLPELAMWACTESQHHGVTRNPWSLQHTPGGSSGGSAAAVAAGLVPAAHATDGLGSIRIPASCAGLVGLKPTCSSTRLARAPRGCSTQRSRRVRRYGSRCRSRRRRRPGCIRRCAPSISAPPPCCVTRATR
jgi:amidase